MSQVAVKILRVLSYRGFKNGNYVGECDENSFVKLVDAVIAHQATIDRLVTQELSKAGQASLQDRASIHHEVEASVRDINPMEAPLPRWPRTKGYTEVGERYRTRDGQLATVLSVAKDKSFHAQVGDVIEQYWADGTTMSPRYWLDFQEKIDEWL